MWHLSLYHVSQVVKTNLKETCNADVAAWALREGTKPTHSALEKSDQGLVTFTLARTKHTALWHDCDPSIRSLKCHSWTASSCGSRNIWVASTHLTQEHGVLHLGVGYKLILLFLLKEGKLLLCLSASLHLMCACYRPYCLHLPWCKAAGVRLDRTETKAPFYSPGSPDCSFPAWGQALLLCLLGEGMAISGLPARDNATSVSESHRPVTGCCL